MDESLIKKRPLRGDKRIAALATPGRTGRKERHRWTPPQDRKLQQRIARRKEKVQRLIKQQEDRLAALNSATFLRQPDYLQAMSIVRKKLHYLEQELSALEAGRLPGIRV